MAKPRKRDCSLEAGAPDAGGRWLDALLRWRPVLRRGFAFDVLTLMSGTAFSQVVVVGSAPILTRVYTPSDYAVFALFAMCMNLIAVVATGRYEFAIMLPRRDKPAAHLALLGLCLAAGVSLLSFALPLLLANSSLLKSPGEAVWLWMVPGAVLLSSWQAVLSHWLARHSRFKGLAFANVCGSLATVGVQIAAGLLLAGAGGTELVAGLLVGQAITLGILLLGLSRDLASHWRPIRWRLVLAEAKRHWQFPAFSTWSGLLNKGVFEAPKLMIAGAFGPHILGLYAHGVRVAGVPLTLLGQSAGKVFFQRIASAAGNGPRCRRMLLTVSSSLLGIVCIPMLIVCVWAEPIFSFVFGEEWAEAGHFFRLLAPMFVARCAVSPIGLSMAAFGRQHVVMAWTTCYLGAAVLSFVPDWNASRAVGCFSLVSCVMYALYFAMAYYYAGKPVGNTGVKPTATGRDGPGTPAVHSPPPQERRSMRTARAIWSVTPERLRRVIRVLRFAFVRAVYGRAVRVRGGSSSHSIEFNDYSEFRAARRFRSFEPEFLAAFDELVSEARTVYDVGGFIGQYTLTAALSRGKPTVCTFEPNDKNCRSISKNLELNGIQNVRLFRCAVGETEGTVRVVPHGSTTSVTPGAEGGGTSAPVTSIDGIVARGEAPPPDVVKIDVEGYEYRVLRGMEDTLRRHRPTVLMEIHPKFLERFGDSEAGVDGLMDVLGYEKILLREPGCGAATTHSQKHVLYRPVWRKSA